VPWAAARSKEADFNERHQRKAALAFLFRQNCLVLS
jgi:hypothetical protein